MKYHNNKIRHYAGMTLVEIVVSLSIMAIIFTAIVPLFRVIQNSWDSKAALAEAMQNGRVLVDHLDRNLAKAVKITAVSESTETNGYIQFEDNDGNNLRYEITSNYVQFGNVGSLDDLAGPVSKLQFTCYDANDLDTSIADINDVNSIRFVEIETTLTNSAALGQDKTLFASVYLRTNGNVTPGDTNQITYDYSNRTQGTDIFAYDGQDGSFPAPATSTIPSDVLSSGEYDDIEFDDGTFHTYSVLNNGRYAMMRFVTQIDENESDVTQIAATWNGKSVNAKAQQSDGASIHIWNYNSSVYELMEASADTEAEVTLTDTLTSSLADYIGGAGADTITLLVVSNGARVGGLSCELFTDYVKLEIAATSGGSGVLLP
jgi:type II secretory pathway pseudopilin PulG